LSMLTGKSVVRLSADNGGCREGWSFRLTELATRAENDLQALSRDCRPEGIR